MERTEKFKRKTQLIIKARKKWPTDRLVTLRAGAQVEKARGTEWEPVELEYQVCGKSRIDGQWQHVYHGHKEEQYRALLSDDAAWVFR